MENWSDLGEADLSYLEELSGGNRDFMREIIDMFVMQTPGDLQQLEDFIVQGDWQQAANQAHRIKPTLNYVGANALREEVQQLEKNAREELHPDQIKAHYDRLRPRFDALISVLGQISQTL